MTIEDIDFDRRRIHGTGKGKQRTVFFGRVAARMLSQYLAQRATGPIFLPVTRQQKGHIGWKGRAWVGYWRDF